MKEVVDSLFLIAKKVKTQGQNQDFSDEAFLARMQLLEGEPDK